MLEILNIRHGAVLNRHDGTETPAGLEITVEGLADAAAPVTVNAAPAVRNGRKFSAPVLLREQFNTIRVEAANGYGTFSQEIKVVWDKASFKRYNFFIDDNSFFFREIAQQRPDSLFDHFYLKFLREMHRKYGLKVTLNCFYRNDHQVFELKDFPDIYKPEWIDNSDWLRLSFHAYSEFPDRPYQDAKTEKLAADFDLVKGELLRIAGAETFIPPVVLHWYTARPEAFQALAARGVKVLDGQYSGGEPTVCDLGYFRSGDDAAYLSQYRPLYDFAHKMLFIKCGCVCNLLSPREIAARLADTPGRDTVSLSTHEQYSFPQYFNYQPDHHEKIEAALRAMAENGCEPVFFAEGLLGNTGWGE